MKEAGQKVYVKNDAVISRKIAGETILVPVRGKLADMRRIFTLNPVAEFIWNLIDGKNNIQNIADNIVSAFDVNHRTSEHDIEEFVAALLRENLITEVD
ncbi:MAG: PqqD family protein [Nitrospirota bacterium]